MHFAFGLSSWHISFSLQVISAHVIMAIRRKIELVNKLLTLVVYMYLKNKKHNVNKNNIFM